MTLTSKCWYFKNFVLSPGSVGSFVPSSSSLAERLVSLEREFGSGGAGPRRILEIGGGTGAITRKILGTMQPGDTLHVVEMHRDFAPVIEKLVLESRPGVASSSVRILNCEFESFAPGVRDETYDVVYCSLPFNSMGARMVADILLQINRILMRSGLLIYFEYISASPLRVALSLFTGNPNPGRLRAVTGRLLSSGGVGAAPVFANFPPAMARCVRRVQRQDALARDLLSCLP
jgi:phospholipid N-methyltransferase